MCSGCESAKICQDERLYKEILLHESLDKRQSRSIIKIKIAETIVLEK